MAYKDPLDPRNREARLRHYHANREQYLERNRQRKLEMREHVSLVKSVPCQDCEGEYPTYVMDLDHRDPNEKCGNIDKFINLGSWKKLLAEIEKCDVVCANCHRERTWGKKI